MIGGGSLTNGNFPPGTIVVVQGKASF
jgi:hypothetical protein